jgi:hypothetical protein
MRAKWFFIVPAAIVGMALFIFIGSWLVMYLWNWLLPPLFGWHTITIWQALGLLVLCRILFGGLGIRRGPQSNMRYRMRQKMRDRWQDMTPEQRERMRDRWRAACGFEPSNESRSVAPGQSPTGS